MTDSKIDAKDLRDLMRCASAMFLLYSDNPKVFGEHAAIIDRAASATVSILATLTDEQRRYIYRGGTA